MKYDIDYFIKKFRAIPDSKWYSGNLSNPANPEQKCALGHCGAKFTIDGYTEEAKALFAILGQVGWINDGGVYEYQQKKPKARVLAALRDKKRVLERIKKGKSL